MIEKEVINQFSIDRKENISNLIREEINVVVSTLSSTNNPTCLHNSSDSIQCTCKSKEILTTSLNSEITFLRNEIASKNKIIEMLINDQLYSNI